MKTEIYSIVQSRKSYRESSRKYLYCKEGYAIKKSQKLINKYEKYKKYEKTDL